MTNDSISSVSSAIAVSSTSSSSAAKLTTATKAKLEALGISTTNITTEAEGQIALKIAQTKAEATKSKPPEKQDESIKTEAKTLASQVGASVSDSDSTDEILNKISSKISELKASAGDDQTKLAEIENYQASLDKLSETYASMPSQAKLDNSMSNLANYNKVSLGLS